MHSCKISNNSRFQLSKSVFGKVRLSAEIDLNGQFCFQLCGLLIAGRASHGLMESGIMTNYDDQIANDSAKVLVFQ